MAGSLCKVQLIGNLGKDPEIRATQDGREIANLSIATSERWKDKTTGERKEKTEWHRVVVFSEGLANVIKNYTKKGSKIYIEGKLQTSKWTDKDGIERYTTEIVIQGYGGTILLLDSKKDNIQNTGSTGDSSFIESANKSAENDLDDEIPF